MSLLDEAIQAIKAGNKAKGRRLLREFTTRQPDNEAAWLWLASAEEAEADKRRCLEQVLQLNPKNEVAREALARLGGSGTSLPQVADIVPPLEAVTSFGASYRWGPVAQRRRRMALIPISLLPLYSLIILFLINPNYIQRLFLSCTSRGLLPSMPCSQPFGWIMLFVALALQVAGLLILLGLVSITSEDTEMTPQHSRRFTCFSLLTIIFLIAPAMFIIGLGPAFMIILETNFGGE